MTALRSVSLDDKYALDRGRVYMTGIQALVRVPMAQRQRDLAARLNTACFISGYRGSPLGTYDLQLWRAKEFVKKNHIHFEPGLNEDLAATAVWGSQQTELYPGAKYDGVFSIWYGKGPGVDRSGDAFKHANFAGTAKHGGVLAIAGDDHVAKSSTIPHQSEYAFMDACIPMLHPAGVQDVLDYGLYGIAMSRFSGCWVGLKATAENMDSSASIEIDPMALEIATPTDFVMPEGGLNVRWPDPWLEQEARLHKFKMPAVLAFARANRLDRVMLASPKPRIGIVTVGKSYLDVRQALDGLGLSEAEAADLGIAIYKVAMPWPLEPEGLKAFTAGLEEVLVIEEKRPLIEAQVKEILYDLPGARPRVVGKRDETGEIVMPTNGEFSAGRIARLLARRLLKLGENPKLAERLRFLEEHKQESMKPVTDFQRIPYFCSGCPHNTSTKVPEGSVSFAGIGCHFLASWMPQLETKTFTQMGAEGSPWIGMAPFTEHKHMFVNLGDGTYTHSGLLAIRAAVAAKVNITYKILYNDAVAMTGGQPAEGAFSVLEIANQVAAERVSALRVITDEPEKYPLGTKWPDYATLHHRDDMDEVQRELRETEGVTIILYDQTCATEKRRRRKRGLMAEPAKRLFINQQVCEGCGDCGVQSNCVSLTPVETEYGRKRAIDQSTCNKDYSCAKGFCPSFVNVIGGQVRKKAAAQPAPQRNDIFPVLPEPVLPALDRPYNILVTGIGGTGVVTIGALLGMAAHLEDKGVTVLDQIGLAQKNGSVVTHVRLAAKPEDLHAVRIASGGADLLLACDMITAAGTEALSKLSLGDTTAIVNTQATMNGAFTQNPDLQFPAEAVKAALRKAAGENSTQFIDANRIATALLGDSIASNLFMLGYAYQRGLVPLSAEAIERAVELNGVAVEFNKKAFLWGRRAAHDLATVEKAAEPTIEAPKHLDLSETVDEMVERRTADLVAYQNKAYADRYTALVGKVRQAERKIAPGSETLTEAVARYGFKLMAYKDEYEVARLYSSPGFRQQLDEQFEGKFRLEVNLAPPAFAQKDPETGRLKKRSYGPWIFPLFRLLTGLKGLRGTAFDPFGRTEERRTERRLIEDYFTDMEEVVSGLEAGNHAAAIELARVPEHIRGYGHVKERHLKDAASRREEALNAFRNPSARRDAAE